MAKSKFHFISLNLLKDKHKDLIEWIKTQSSEDEMSISSFCIKILKEYKRSKNEKETKKME